MTVVAAVDQGSSSTKGALIDARGAVLARAEAPVTIRREGERASHDPAALVASVRAVLDTLAAHARPDAVALACQRSTCLLWERASGRPLTAALSWQDVSAAGRLAALVGDEPEVARRTGLRLSAHYAGAKLAQLLEETGLGERAGRGEVIAGTLDAFLVHALVGAPSTEPGHAGRTLLHDLDADAWDPWLASRFGVPSRALPPILPSAGARGALRDGPLAGVPLLALAGDQQAALVGNGGRGDVAVAHFGTGAFVLADVGPTPLRHAGLLASTTWTSAPARRRFQLEGSVNSAGSAVDWAVRTTGADLAAAGEAPLDPERLPAFLPGFVGVGAPWWAPSAGAVLAGARLDAGGDQLVRAVLAGVAMRVVDCLEALVGAGLALETVRASGRLARLPALGQLLADASGLAVEVMAEEEAGLRGAAHLAALALGGDEAVLAAAPPVLRRHFAQGSTARRERLRRRWKAFLEAALAIPADRP